MSEALSKSLSVRFRVPTAEIPRAVTAAKPTPHRSASPYGSIPDQTLNDRQSQLISYKGEPKRFALRLPHPKRMHKAFKFPQRMEE